MFLEIVPYSSVIVGLLIFVVGFIFHWIGQLISVLNWDLATKWTLQEKKNPPEFKVYEHATALADVILGWIYGIVAVGLILDISWAYKLVWIPGTVFLYHGLNYWFWKGNQNKIGMRTTSNRFRITWTLLNLGTGILSILIAG